MVQVAILLNTMSLTYFLYFKLCGYEIQSKIFCKHVQVVQNFSIKVFWDIPRDNCWNHFLFFGLGEC